jgi:putative phosphoesterase
LLVGVVSDTHGYLDQRLLEAFAGVDAIIHAGDVGHPDILTGLRAIAPLYAVQGNNDVPLTGLDLPENLDLNLGGLSIHVVHELRNARSLSAGEAVVFGHSHRQLCEWRHGVLYLNPGAAGRRGFHAIQTAALLRIEAAVPAVEPLILGPRLH